jgi:quercetin dioxygenase-like cupin family protein
MIMVDVFYPNKAGTKFELNYFCNTHIPLVEQKLGTALKPILKNRFIVITALCIALTQAALAQAEKEMAEPSTYSAADIVWKDGPAALPPGAKVAVLEGDPAKEGFFTMRLLLPDGYKVPPHVHPKVEHVTVISGTMHLGMGEQFDQGAGRTLPAGIFGFWPAGMKHFAWFTGETIIQLHGIGPWGINYVNPADDPRNAKK